MQAAWCSMSVEILSTAAQPCKKWHVTRSTGTVHISAKARLTSVAIRIHMHQNLVTRFDREGLIRSN